MGDVAVKRHALTLLILALSCQGGMCAQVPVLRQGMTLKAARVAVARAGWRGPRHRYCAADGGDAKGDLRYCGGGFSLAFLRLVPETLDRPEGHPVMNVCYEDRGHDSLQITFSYDPRVEDNAAKLAASLRLDGWYIEDTIC